MTGDELAALIERNEERKHNNMLPWGDQPRATTELNNVVTDDIDQLLALVADLQSALAEK